MHVFPPHRAASCAGYWPVASGALTISASFGTIILRKTHKRKQKGRPHMKRIPKLLSAVLACVMLCALFSGVSFAADTPAAVVEQTVTSGELAYTFYRYTPANFNFRGNNTPLLYVLADKGFTVESARSASARLPMRRAAPFCSSARRTVPSGPRPTTP